MTTIRLLDARRGLNRKCEELFGDAKIAEAIYRYLCDGIEECEDAEPQRKKGKWIWQDNENRFGWTCSECGYGIRRGRLQTNYCPNCGSEMVKGEDDDN